MAGLPFRREKRRRDADDGQKNRVFSESSRCRVLKARGREERTTKPGRSHAEGLVQIGKAATHAVGGNRENHWPSVYIVHHVQRTVVAFASEKQRRLDACRHQLGCRLDNNGVGLVFAKNNIPALFRCFDVDNRERHMGLDDRRLNKLSLLHCDFELENNKLTDRQTK